MITSHLSHTHTFLYIDIHTYISTYIKKSIIIILNITFNHLSTFNFHHFLFLHLMLELCSIELVYLFMFGIHNKLSITGLPVKSTAHLNLSNTVTLL